MHSLPYIVLGVLDCVHALTSFAAQTAELKPAMARTMRSSTTAFTHLFNLRIWRPLASRSGVNGAWTLPTKYAVDGREYAQAQLAIVQPGQLDLCDFEPCATWDWLGMSRKYGFITLAIALSEALDVRLSQVSLRNHRAAWHRLMHLLCRYPLLTSYATGPASDQSCCNQFPLWGSLHQFINA